MAENDNVILNKDKKRFEIPLGTEFARLEYRWYDGNMALMHTFVPETSRGQGVADKLAKAAFEYVRKENIKAIVYCHFVAQYVKEHPEYNELITQKK